MGSAKLNIFYDYQYDHQHYQLSGTGHPQHSPSSLQHTTFSAFPASVALGLSLICALALV